MMCKHLWIHLVQDSLCFLYLCAFVLHQIREVLVIIFSNRFPISCLFSSSGIPMMQMLLCFMISKIFLKFSSFFNLFKHFAVLLWCFFLLCLPNHLFNPLLHLTYCLFLLVYYLFQILHYLFLTGLFYGFYVFFILLRILIIITLNSIADKLLTKFHLVLLLEYSIFLLFEACFFAIPFLDVCLCLFLCIR